MQVRAIRGAISVPENSKEAISSAVVELLKKILEVNELSEDDLISVLFTVTGDLNQEFPATAARSLGLANTPLICAREIDVPGSMSGIIRILIHAYSRRSKFEIEHIYLRDAAKLRKDLSK